MPHHKPLTDFVSTHPAFSSLGSSGRTYVLSNLIYKTLRKGEVIFKEDDPGDTIYYVAQGEVVLDGAMGRHIQPEGTFLGVESVITNDDYHNTAKALTPLVLVALPRLFIKPFILKHPEILSHFLATDEKEGPKKEAAEPPLKLREIIGYFATFIVPITLYNLLGGTWIDPAITLFLCVLSATVTMWFFRLFPSYIPALFFLLAILSIGLAPPEVILRGFSTQTFIILMSTFTLGASILLSGLGHRIMLIFFNKFSKSYFKSNLALFFSGVFLTPFMPSIIARAEIAAPMYLEATQALRFKHGSTATTQLSITLFSGITLFSSVFLSGSLMNYMVLALLPEYMQVHFSWLVWIQAASVYGLIVLVGYLSASLYFRKDAQNVKIDKAMLKDQLLVLGPMTPAERLVILALTLFMLGILTTAFHKIETAWIAFFVMFFLLLFHVLATKQFRSHIDWPFLIVISTTIGISYVLQYLHADKYLFDSFVKLMNDYQMNSIEFLLFSAALTFFVRIILPLGPAAVVSGTLTIPLATHYQTHPWVIAFTVLVMIDVWFFKHQSPTYTLFKKQARLNKKLVYDEKKFMIFNYFMNALKLVGLTASIPLWKFMGML